MNVNVRETGGHIEFEPSSYYAAFSCELEAAAYPMWSVLAHLSEPAHAPLARRIVAAALKYLQDWLHAVNFTAPRLHRVSYSFFFDARKAFPQSDQSQCGEWDTPQNRFHMLPCLGEYLLTSFHVLI